METQKTKPSGILDTEMFVNQNRQYYFDIKKTKDQRHYLRITRRDQQTDETFKRKEIVFFEDDIKFLVEAMSMLLGRYCAGHLGISA